MEMKVQRAFRKTLLAMLCTMVCIASASAGPLILGGDDLTDHGSVTTVPGSGVTIPEAEPNNSATTANLIAIGDNYTGNINPATDSDFITFVASGRVRIVASIVLGTLPDSTLTLLDTDGTTALAFNDNFVGLASMIEFLLPRAGTYFLRVQSFGGGSSGTYTLQLRQGGPLLEGWLYIQRALENISPPVTRPGNDGSIAALGSQPSTATSGNAGAAIGVAAAAAGLRVTFYEGATAINTFFADLASGATNPAIIWTAGTGAVNNLDSAEGAALTANAQAIADFVNSGGGLLSHGSGSDAYGWLTTLIPGLAEVSGCNAVGAMLTAVGMAAFPGLSNSDIDANAGPCHSHFEGNLGTLEVLAVDGNGRNFIIGGGGETIIAGQIVLGPLAATNSVGTNHTVTATVTAASPPFDPLADVLVTFEVTSGPNLGASGTDTTDAHGMASFTYRGNGGAGTDQIRASISGPAPGTTTLSNLVKKCWSLVGDVNCNGTLDLEDAQLILEVLVGFRSADTPPAINFTAGGDVNADGIINNLDSILLLGILDGGIPPLPDNTRITAIDNGSGSVTVAGRAGAVPSASKVQLTNATSGAIVLSAPAGSDGHFSAVIAAVPGDRIIIAIVDALDEPGPARVAITVTDTFQAAQSFAAGDAPQSVTVADVNGDDHPDVVTANTNSNDITVLLGNGDGTFQAAQRFAVGLAPLSVTVADVNGDTHLDVITANGNSDDIAVLLGNGDGTFQAARRFPTGPAGVNPTSVTVADVNGDTHLDVITANNSSNDIAVLLGNGDGTFQAARLFPTGVAPFAVTVLDVNGTVLDVNGDTHPDVITVNGVSNDIAVLLGNGDGTFQAARSFAAGDLPFAVTVVDVNDDGHLDVIVANNVSNDIAVLLGNGDGTFQAAQRFAAGDGPFGVTVADVNFDGHLDVITANFISSDIAVLLGNGDGTFQAAQRFTAGLAPASVTAVDVNGDTRPDVITANFGSDDITVLLHR